MSVAIGLYILTISVVLNATFLLFSTYLVGQSLLFIVFSSPIMNIIGITANTIFVILFRFPKDDNEL